MILFVGQVAWDIREREAFQELDYRAVFGLMEKWVTEIDDPERIPGFVLNAFHVATSGRPGPVVILLRRHANPASSGVGRPKIPDLRDCSNACRLSAHAGIFGAARRPLVIVSGSRWDQGRSMAWCNFSSVSNCQWPSFWRQSLFPARLPNFAGDLGVGANPKLIDYTHSPISYYSWAEVLRNYQPGLHAPRDSGAKAELVDIHPGTDRLGRVYRPDLGINVSRCTVDSIAHLQPRTAPDRGFVVADVRNHYLRWSERRQEFRGPSIWAARYAFCVRLPANAVIANGAGNFAAWVHRFYRFEQFGTQLAPNQARWAMASGWGRSLADKSGTASRSSRGRRRFPDAWSGICDGSPVRTTYRRDRGRQRHVRYDPHASRTGISRTRLRQICATQTSRLCDRLRGHGETVERMEDFLPVFERALTVRKPAIIHCLANAEAITPTRSLSAIWTEAMAVHVSG